MAIYHLSVKAVSRSAGRSSTAAAAYRAGCKIVDENTGVIFDYTKKKGIESADIILPRFAPSWAADRSQLWNSAERAEKRKDSCVAREFEVALPAELSASERRRLVLDFAQEMAEAEGCAVDVAIHKPNGKHDNLNHHAHILRTTRKVEAEGLGAKLDTEQAGRNRKADLEAVRARWAELVNERLAENGFTNTVDHRTLEAQGIERLPTVHNGPTITDRIRKGRQSNVLEKREEEAAPRRAAVAKMEAEGERIDYQIGNLEAALEEATIDKAHEQERNNLARERQSAAMSLFAKGGFSRKEPTPTPEPVAEAEQPRPNPMVSAMGMFAAASKKKRLEGESEQTTPIFGVTKPEPVEVNPPKKQRSRDDDFDFSP